MGRKRRAGEQDDGGGEPSANKRHKHTTAKITHAPWWNMKMQGMSQRYLHIPNESSTTNIKHKVKISWIDADIISRNPYELLFVNSENHEPLIYPLSNPQKKEEKHVQHVAKRSKQECPAGYVVRCYKIKLKPDKDFKTRAQGWIRTCRLWRSLALKYLLRQHPKGFRKAPNWKNLRNEIMNRETGPYAKHKCRDYLFNKWEVIKGKEKQTKVYCSKDMKVATIHKLCSSIGSTIESLKEKEEERTREA